MSYSIDEKGLDMFHSIRSQSAMDMLLLISLILVIALAIVFYATRPNDEVIISRSQGVIDIIKSSAEEVARMGPGNKIKVKLDVPSELGNIAYSSGSIYASVFSGSSKETNVHNTMGTSLVGCLDDSYLNRGSKEYIFESIGDSVCAYPPGDRNDCCYCFDDDQLFFPKLQEITESPWSGHVLCEVDGVVQECNSSDSSFILNYSTIMTGFRSKCLDSNSNTIDGAHVTYEITNRLNQTVYEGTSVSNVEGYFNLNNIDYTIENSGPLNITATCYHSCYYVKNNDGNLKDSKSVIVDIPYGRLVPFLLNKSGDKIYMDYTDSLMSGFGLHYYLVDSSGQDKWHLDKGWVRSGDKFVVRTGYDCVGGECLMVNSSLYHGGIS